MQVQDHAHCFLMVAATILKDRPGPYVYTKEVLAHPDVDESLAIVILQYLESNGYISNVWREVRKPLPLRFSISKAGYKWLDSFS